MTRNYLIKIVVRLVATNMSRKERRKGRVETWKTANDKGLLTYSEERELNL